METKSDKLNKVILGKTASGAIISLLIDILLRTRMLIQANSGKGKSWLLRRIAEQLFGKVQVIIIDPEGEFATLRESFAYALIGKGGEAQAHPKIAALTAQRLLELRASAVIDLYEMKPSERHTYVKNFLDALVDSPKSLWHPLVVIIDEIHTFCPEKGAGESEASDSVIAFATRGRKRGFCLIGATQRLGKLRKDAAAELNNVVIGGTFIDIDRKRAADALGVYGPELNPFFNEIRLLESGKFYFLGPAVATERTLVTVGEVNTTHPEAGSERHAAEAPPTPDKIKALLPRLADIPKEAEATAKNVAELTKQLRETKAELAKRPTEIKNIVEEKIVEVPVISSEHLLSVGESLAEMKALWEVVTGALNRVQQTPRKSLRPTSTVTKSPIKVVFVPPSNKEPSGGLSKSHIKVLSRLVELLDCTGDSAVSKEQLAAWSEYSPNSGGYNNLLGALRSGGYIQYPSPGQVAITDDGREVAQPGDTPSDSAEMLSRAKRVLGGSEARILEQLHTLHPDACTKSDLAEAVGFSSNSGGFNNYLGHMRTLGFIDYPQPGQVRCSDWLFL